MGRSGGWGWGHGSPSGSPSASSSRSRSASSSASSHLLSGRRYSRDELARKYAAAAAVRVYPRAEGPDDHQLESSYPAGKDLNHTCERWLNIVIEATQLFGSGCQKSVLYGSLLNTFCGLEVSENSSTSSTSVKTSVRPYIRYNRDVLIKKYAAAEGISVRSHAGAASDEELAFSFHPRDPNVVCEKYLKIAIEATQLFGSGCRDSVLYGSLLNTFCGIELSENSSTSSTSVKTSDNSVRPYISYNRDVLAKKYADVEGIKVCSRAGGRSDEELAFSLRPKDPNVVCEKYLKIFIKSMRSCGIGCSKSITYGSLLEDYCGIELHENGSTSSTTSVHP